MTQTGTSKFSRRGWYIDRRQMMMLAAVFLGSHTITSHLCPTWIILARQKKYPRLFYRSRVCKTTLWNFCCLAAGQLAEENQPFSETKRTGIPRGAVVAGIKCHSSPWKTGHQNHALEVPVYLLNMPLVTVRMCCICWLKLKEDKSTLHLHSFLQSFQDHQ